MSYTFSRRDFMKYSAVAAVAVAGSSMFTGCSLISNPNRPTGTIGDTLKPGGNSCDVKLLGGGDAPKYDSVNHTLTCKFSIYTRTDQLEIDQKHFQLDITDKDGKRIGGFFDGASDATVTIAGGSAAGVKKYDTVEPTVTFKFTGTTPPDLNSAKSISVIYLPKRAANGQPTDSFSDVYATWTFEPKAIGLGAAAGEGN